MTSASSESVSKEDIHELLEHSVKNTHKVKDGDIKVRHQLNLSIT